MTRISASFITNTTAMDGITTTEGIIAMTDTTTTTAPTMPEATSDMMTDAIA